MSQHNRLIVIAGPTGSGKSALALDLAERLHTHIVSADSRQMFREIPIGTAAPSAADRARLPHHFVGNLTLTDTYSAADYERDALALIARLFDSGLSDVVVCGGSMLYVDALCNGLDTLPTVTPEARRHAEEIFERGGLQALRLELLDVDPVHYRHVDLNNPRRIIHALEIFYTCGTPISRLHTNRRAQRPFTIERYAVDIDRETLFSRINRRVELMMQNGLLEEARSVAHLRHLNSLNTVGYKELFAHFDGEFDLPTAVARIQKNTRVYAKKQMLWVRSNPDIKLISDASRIVTIK